MGLTVEASELLEIFTWLTEEESAALPEEKRQAAADEVGAANLGEPLDFCAVAAIVIAEIDTKRIDPATGLNGRVMDFLRRLAEVVEIKDHPWFLGCQYHPEFKSRPMDPHPLFTHFIRAALERKQAAE